MADKIINVKAELDTMKTYITDLEHCTSKVNEIGTSAYLYKSNMKTNIFTMLATVYAVACVFLKYNIILLAAGVVLVVVMFIVARNDIRGSFKTSCFFNILLLVSTAACFMYLYDSIPPMALLAPVAILLIDWIYTIVSNYKFKKLVWDISNSL